MTLTLEEIQNAAKRFRANGHSVMDVREILQAVTGLALTDVADVPEADRAAVIAKFEGRETTTAKGSAGSSLLTPDGKALDATAIWSHYNSPSRGRHKRRA